MKVRLISVIIFSTIAFAITFFRPLTLLSDSLSRAASQPQSAQAETATTTSAEATASTPAAPQAAETPNGAAPVISAPVAEAAQPENSQTQGDNRPARVSIPAIGLDDPIQPLGLNSKGEMDVPNGSTQNVGWYEYGTVPGELGSAVFDAHVFAAFSNLKDLRVGNDIYVTENNGTKLHFKVYETDVYPLADVPLTRMFADSSGRYLNLITCAGKLTPDRSTYDHRLVVYAELVN